jgi:hypothetical protein
MTMCEVESVGVSGVEVEGAGGRATGGEAAAAGEVVEDGCGAGWGGRGAGEEEGVVAGSGGAGEDADDADWGTDVGSGAAGEGAAAASHVDGAASDGTSTLPNGEERVRRCDTESKDLEPFSTFVSFAFKGWKRGVDVMAVVF